MTWPASAAVAMALVVAPWCAGAQPLPDARTADAGLPLTAAEAPAPAPSQRQPPAEPPGPFDARTRAYLLADMLSPDDAIVTLAHPTRRLQGDALLRELGLTKLVEQREQRRRLKFWVGASGLTAVALGGALWLSDFQGRCVRYRGSVNGLCLETNYWPGSGGLIAAILGAGAVLVASLLPATLIDGRTFVEVVDEFTGGGPGREPRERSP